MPLFAITIFVGAFLLFQVQPIVGRYILPWFGGGASVWTTCMLFFQVLLLGGYGYAHLISSRLKPRGQLVVHLALLAAACAFLPVSPAQERWRYDGDAQQPIAIILWRLLTQVGLPYFVLASTGPLAQAWFAARFPQRSPFRLYALSNLASLLALLSYPFLIENHLNLSVQGWVWSAGFGLYALLCGACVWRFANRTQAPVAGATAGVPPRTGDAPPARSVILLWLALSAAGSMMLLATTNQLCQDLAVVPLLWVIPLAIYLITFIICFDRDSWYKRWLFVSLMGASVLAVNYILHDRISVPFGLQIAGFCIALFASCMVCHGELVRLKPAPAHLTRYYLIISAGGAIGGLLVALAAPLLLPDYWEFHIALMASLALGLICLYLASLRRLPVRPRRWSVAAGILVCLVMAFSMIAGIYDDQTQFLVSSRSFYGVLHVFDATEVPHGGARKLVHGLTIHGSQFHDPAKRHWPTTYYGRDSGVGLGIAYVAGGRLGDPARKPMRLGVVGLGAGVIAAHAGRGDDIRYYEIDPSVERLAREHFTFLADTKATVEVQFGDARVLLQREAESGQRQAFDLLAIDAFNSDAIPIHLITEQAFDVYTSHLRDPEKGLIAFHISNRNANLLPVLRGLASARGQQAVLIVDTGDFQQTGSIRSVWVVLTRDQAFARSPQVAMAADLPPSPSEPTVRWTDDFASLWSVIAPGGTSQLGRWTYTPNGGQFVINIGSLIDMGDEDRIQFEARRLYSDTAGRCAMAVVALESRRDVEVDMSRAAYDRDVRRAYDRMQLNRTKDDGGLLIFVSRADSMATLWWGDGWTREERESGGPFMANLIMPALKAGKTSAALRDGAIALAEHLRLLDAKRRSPAGPPGK